MTKDPMPMIEAACSDAVESFKDIAFATRPMTELEHTIFRAGFMAGTSWGTDYARKMIAPKLS